MKLFGLKAREGKFECLLIICTNSQSFSGPGKYVSNDKLRRHMKKVKFSVSQNMEFSSFSNFFLLHSKSSTCHFLSWLNLNRAFFKCRRLWFAWINIFNPCDKLCTYVCIKFFLDEKALKKGARREKIVLETYDKDVAVLLSFLRGNYDVKLDDWSGGWKWGRKITRIKLTIFF